MNLKSNFFFLILFALGGLANLGQSEAVLPAYLIGMVLAPFFMRQNELQRRMRSICFAFLTPFYFLKAGSLIEAKALVAGAGLIAAFFAIKMMTKFAGILPLTRYFKFDKREGMYTTLMMSTGLTFGSISALFGLTNHIIDQEQYTILLTAVIGSAVVPTLIAQIWFQPHFEPLEEDAYVPLGLGLCLLWVISGHVRRTRSCLLCPRKRHQMRHLECPLWANSERSISK